MSPTVSVVLLATLCLLTTALLVLSVQVRARLRVLPGPEVARLLEELQREQSALKDAVDRLKPDKRTGRAAGSSGARSHRVDRAEENAVPGPTLIAVPNLAAVPDVTSARSQELGQRFGSIWSLADEGASADTIAQRTGQPIGQVELILGLRRQLVAQGVLNPLTGSRP